MSNAHYTSSTVVEELTKLREATRRLVLAVEFVVELVDNPDNGFASRESLSGSGSMRVLRDAASAVKGLL